MPKKLLSSSFFFKKANTKKITYNFFLGDSKFLYREFNEKFYSHSHKFTSAWETATFPDIHEFLKSTNASLEGGAHFSMLNPNYITRNLTDIREIFSAVGVQGQPIDTKGAERQLRNLVVFKPERLLLHEIIVQSTTQLQIESDAHFQSIVKLIHKKAKQEIQDRREEIDEISNYYRGITEQELANYKIDGDNHTALHQMMEPIFKTVLEKAKKNIYIPGNHVPNETVHSVVGKIISDDLIRKHWFLTINEIVTSHMEESLKTSLFERLPLYSNLEREDILVGLTQYGNQERITFMVAGGPASGKGILTERIAAMLKMNEMQLQNFALIAPDRYKIVLGEEESLGTHKIYQGTLLQEECRLIAENARDRIMEMAKVNQAPNTFIEMLVPYPDKVELGTYGGGKFRVYVASAEPVSAVDGSFKRFQDIGRFVPKEYVLEGQKRVSAYMPKFILENQKKNSDIRLEVHDTTGAFDDPSAKYRNPILIIEPSMNSVSVFDISKMFEFIQKEDINSNATHPEELYTIQRDVDELAKKLKENYGKGTICFVDPQGPIDYSTMEEKTYAIFDGEPEWIEITNAEIFDRMLKNKIYRKTFQILDSTIGEDTESTLKNRENYTFPGIIPWKRK